MRAWHVFALLAGVAACDLAQPTDDVVEPPVGYGPGLGTTENPIPRDGVTYAARSRIAPDTGDAIRPDVASVVATLRAFSQAPAQTLITIAAGANLPELDQLYSELPAALESQLVGWIDAELDTVKIGGSGMRHYATALSGYAEIAMTRFVLDSTMSFTPTRATHTVTSIGFELGDVNVVVPIGGLKADAINQQVPVTVAERGLITFGDHQFGLAFGEHVWQGLNLASQTAFGFDVRSSFDDTIDCVQLSQVVASKCIDTECVGHQPALQTLCEQSLDRLVLDLSQQVNAFDADLVRYVAGSARLVDEDGDGLANRIADGVWDSELVVGPARGTFTAFADGR